MTLTTRRKLFSETTRRYHDTMLLTKVITPAYAAQ